MANKYNTIQIQNKFALSHAEDNTSRLLLAIRQKSGEPSFWEVIDSFALLAYASLAASRTLLQWLLACLKFTLEAEDLFFCEKWQSDFYELWQQHK